MFVQVVTYSLEGISEEGYLDVANGVAPRYAGLPGLLAKIWLENPGGNRYGAVYFWEDAESMERFGNSDLFEGDTEEFVEFLSEEFKVLENLTAMTQPVLQILEGGGRATPAPRTAAPAKKAAAGTTAAAARKRTPPPPKKAAGAAKGATKPAKAPPKTVARAATKVTGKKTPAVKEAGKRAAAKKAGKKAVR